MNQLAIGTTRDLSSGVRTTALATRASSAGSCSIVATWISGHVGEKHGRDRKRAEVDHCTEGCNLQLATHVSCARTNVCVHQHPDPVVCSGLPCIAVARPSQAVAAAGRRRRARRTGTSLGRRISSARGLTTKPGRCDTSNLLQTPAQVRSAPYHTYVAWGRVYRRMAATSIFSSRIANFCPMQLRGPAENGTYAYMLRPSLSSALKL
jgi:hypothetical protein